MSVRVLNSLRNISILVHDETPYFRRVMRSFLAGEGCKSVEMSEDIAGLPNKLWALQPDLLILSWEPDMPERADLMRRIREGERKLGHEFRVIATTMCSDRAFVQSLADHTINGAVLKPFNANTVLKQVHRMAAQIAEGQAQALLAPAEARALKLIGGMSFNRR